MNRLSIILLLGITIFSSMALGTAATKVNYKILPFRPISISSQETNENPKINHLNVTCLATANIVMYPTPHLNYTFQTEFEQGEIMGVYLIYEFGWDNLPPIIPDSTSVSGKTDEYIYFGGNLSAHIVTTLQIYDFNGQLVADSNNIGLLSGGGSSSGTSGRRCYIQIPYSWDPGTYTIRVDVEDLISGFEDSKETIVNILVGPPPEEKHPSPIATNPADMIIGLADLSDGWTIAWENSDSSILEDCVSSFQRGFNRLVGEYKHVFFVRVIQFENVDSANRSFHARLDMVRSNEEYGHGQVILKDIGDGGFLFDNIERRSTEWRGWDTDGTNSTSWATGSSVIFIKENIIVGVGDMYNYEAISNGVFITPDELVEFAMVQAAKIT